eukprot:444985-Hanusia_phi.AAC.1
MKFAVSLKSHQQGETEAEERRKEGRRKAKEEGEREEERGGGRERGRERRRVEREEGRGRERGGGGGFTRPPVMTFTEEA